MLELVSISLHLFKKIRNMLQVAAKKQTLKNVTDYIADIISKRADLGHNYGVILIPEGLIDFIPEVKIMSCLLVF